MSRGTRYRLAVLAASALLVIAASSGAGIGTADAQSVLRTVEGTVRNGTVGGGDVSGQPVMLHRVGVSRLEDISTTTDESGAFRFDEVEYDPDLRYGVSVRYQDAVYGTDIDLSDGSPDHVELTVYDATHDDTIVSAASASLLLASADGSDQTVGALEIIRLANRSDRAYVPGSGVMELLRFGLPPGATDLTLDTFLIGADYVQVDRGFALLASVPPGEHEVMFSYRFPYESERFALSKTYRYGAEKLRILAPEEVVSISSEMLGSPEPVQIGERQYQVIEAEGLERGASISLNLDGLPLTTTGQRISGSFSDIRFEYAAPVALVLLMAALLVYGVMRRTNASARDETP